MTIMCLALRLALAAAQQSPIPISTLEGPLVTASGVPLVEVTLRFDDDASRVLEVIRLVRSATDRAWRLAEVATRKPAAGQMTMRGTIGSATLIVIRSVDRAGYIVVGPMRWPDQPRTYPMPTEWRRTVRGRFSGDSSGSLTWVSAEREPRGPWPMCSWIDRDDWECIGVPLADAGAVLITTPGKVLYAMATGSLSSSGVELVPSGEAAWGRLVVVDPVPGVEKADEPVWLLARRLHMARARPKSVRLETEAENGISIDRIGPRAFWVSGNGGQIDAWVEATGKSIAPSRIEIQDLLSAPPEILFRVGAQRAQSIAGRVTVGSGEAAPHAVVALYRLERDRLSGDTHAARRVVVEEVTSDQEGVFRFDHLALEPYEIVAMHAALGRGERRAEANGQDIEVRLRRPSRAVGRVLRNGVPAAAVRVMVVPDLAQFAASADITELRGGETETDEDGRFSVLLAMRGSGELRAGDERAGVRRIPLGPAESLPGIVDVGTLELAPLPALTLVLEGAGACELLLTGPAGRTGMTLVRPTRIGPAMFQATAPEPGAWHVVGVCGGRERAVVPSTIDVTAATHERSVRLTWANAK